MGFNNCRRCAALYRRFAGIFQPCQPGSGSKWRFCFFQRKYGKDKTSYRAAKRAERAGLVPLFFYILKSHNQYYGTFLDILDIFYMAQIFANITQAGSSKLNPS